MRRFCQVPELTHMSFQTDYEALFLKKNAYLGKLRSWVDMLLWLKFIRLYNVLPLQMSNVGIKPLHLRFFTLVT